MRYKRRSRDSVVIIVTRLQARTGDFSPLRSVWTDPGATWTSLQLVQPRAVCAEHEADHFRLVASLRMCGTLPSSLICRYGMHRDDFISQ